MTTTREQTDAFMKMTPAEEEAHMAALFGGEQPADAESPAEQAGEAAEEPAAPEAPPEAEAPAAPSEQQAADPEVVQGTDTRLVPHQALHQERQLRQEAINARLAAEARAARAEAALAQAAAQQQQQPATTAPAESGLAIEDPAVINALAAAQAHAILAPHLDAIQQLTAQNAQLKEQNVINDLATRHNDPQVAAKLAQFDAEVPHYKAQGLPIQARYYMAQGILGSDPALQQQQQAQAQAAIASQARELAVQKEQAKLASTPTPKPNTPSLHGVPPAVPNGGTIDPGSMTMAQFNALSPEAEEKLLRGNFSR